MKKIVVLLSGQGANLQALINACQRGAIDGKIAAVISNRADAYGLIRAREANIPTALFERSNYSDNQAMDKAIGDFIAEIGADLIVLAGYMKILSKPFVERFAGRILNIHPSLLPKYKGLNTYQQAMQAGDSEHGTTVHFVTPELDSGAVILQARVPIFADDEVVDVEARVKEQELHIYPLVVQWFVSGRLHMKQDRAYLDGRLLPPSGYADE